MKLQFGKYRGRELHSVPVSYPQWLLENGVVGGEVKAEIQNYLRRNFQNPAGISAEALDRILN